MSRDLVAQAFCQALDLPSGTEVESFEIGSNPEWDSVGHMALVAELEDRFAIQLETDDIVEMSSYSKLIEILQRHGIEV